MTDEELETRILELPQADGSAVASSATALEASSSIGAGLSIVGKIVGNGKLTIFGHVAGEVHASTVQIGDGGQVEGNIVAEELTIGGRVKGTIHVDLADHWPSPWPWPKQINLNEFRWRGA